MGCNKATYKFFFECLRISIGSVWWFVFLEFLTPFTLGDHNFLIFNLFSTIVNESNALRRGVQVLFELCNNGALSLDPAYLEHLNVQSSANLPYYITGGCESHIKAFNVFRTL
jgi:hypothetical protein